MLTSEEVDKIRSMIRPTEMERAERKRPHGALARRMENSEDLPPGALEKYQATSSNLGKFELLKAFLMDQNIKNLQIEAEFEENLAQYFR